MRALGGTGGILKQDPDRPLLPPARHVRARETPTAPQPAPIRIGRFLIVRYLSIATFRSAHRRLDSGTISDYRPG
jgi:hypothetical protein